MPRFYVPADGDVLIDCGAHVGLFTVLMAGPIPDAAWNPWSPSPRIISSWRPISVPGG